MQWSKRFLLTHIILSFALILACSASAQTQVSIDNSKETTSLEKNDPFVSKLGLDYNELISDEQLRDALISTNLEGNMYKYFINKYPWNKEKAHKISVRFMNKTIAEFVSDNTSKLALKYIWEASPETFAVLSHMNTNDFPKLVNIIKQDQSIKEGHESVKRLQLITDALKRKNNK